MNIARLSPVHMTPVERLQGRFMRAPDHDATEDDNGLDNDDDDDQDDDQSSHTDDDAEGDDQEGEADGSETSDDDDDSDGKRNGHRNGYERRIAKLTARNKRMEQELQELRKGAKPQDTPKPANNASAKPELKDFDNYEDWIEALTDYKADQKVKQSKAETDRDTAERDFLKRFNAEKKTFKDWDSLDLDFEISKAMQSAIRDADKPAAIIRYLAQNPDEAEEISELPAGKQAIRIGRIEAKLESGNSPTGNKTPKKQSDAPEPITTTKAKDKTLGKSYEDMSFGEFVAARRRDEARASGR
jgi:hypothetical protein